MICCVCVILVCRFCWGALTPSCRCIRPFVLLYYCHMYCCVLRCVYCCTAVTDDEELLDFLHHGIGIMFDDRGSPVPETDFAEADIQVRLWME